tara:strand:+ start:2553 stop:2672 length:120 start_codon:yes stop_codon:yes gene_type:complete
MEQLIPSDWNAVATVFVAALCIVLAIAGLMALVDYWRGK